MSAFPTTDPHLLEKTLIYKQYVKKSPHKISKQEMKKVVEKYYRFPIVLHDAQYSDHNVDFAPFKVAKVHNDVVCIFLYKFSHEFSTLIRICTRPLFD